jgi:hypothetical protein
VEVQNLIDNLKQIRLFMHQLSGNSHMLHGIMYKYELLIFDSENIYLDVHFFHSFIHSFISHSIDLTQMWN